MSDRDVDGISNRSLLQRALDSDMQTEDERQLLTEYQCILERAKECETELCNIRQQLRDITERSQYVSSPYKILRSSEAEIIKRIDAWDKELLNLEQTDVLKNVIEREKKKAYARAAQEGREALARYREREAEKQKELIKRYHEKRQAALKEMADQQKKEQQERSNNVKQVLASIPLSVLGLLVTYLVYGITTLAIALVFVILSYIPIVSAIVEWLLRAGDNTPDMYAMFFGTVIAYMVLTETAKRIINNEETRRRSLRLTGIVLTALNVVFLIINLISRAAILPNVLLAISGIVLFYNNKTK